MLNGSLILELNLFSLIGEANIIPLNKLLQSLGISHLIYCPHMHQQNGAIERKHCHIVEAGLAILSHASVPFHYWDDAFSCYLINPMPTPLLKNHPPFEILSKCKLDFKFLRTFGCACWPNLRPYNSNKLQPRSLQCIFLGYNPNHKGYKCLNLSTKRLYISRDVVFDEGVFPLTLMSNKTLDQPHIPLQVHGISPTLVARPPATLQPIMVPSTYQFASGSQLPCPLPEINTDI